MRSFLLLGVLTALSAGCGKPEEVQHYQVPKDPSWRMLAAIVPASNETWFFKVVAPPSRLAASKDEFVGFIRSLKIEGAVTWTLPAGWTTEPGSGDRRSTLRFGSGDPRLEVSVVRLPGDAGGILQNVNRWRGQLGLDPIGEAALASQSTPIELPGSKALLVDLEGPRRPPAGPMMGGSMGGGEPGPASSPKPSASDYRSLFAYQVPAGWIENPKPQSDRILEFRAGEKGGGALVTLSIFPGRTGDVGSNVNRWRQQAGLDPLGPEAALQQARSMVFLGREGLYVEILGPSRGIVCIFVLDSEASMFLKMDGPPEAVDQQKPVFHSFVQSLKVNKHG
ncbi:MAG TPA: hypothetical protein VEN81_12170 [Planctomycetota bacterium]|nr:hypothetical protein [Planctomycetota bacterium]